MLSPARVERLIEASADEDVRRILTDCGYPDGGVDSSEAIEALLQGKRRETEELLESICPDGRIVDVFKVKFDYHNLKVYLKAEAMGTAADGLYSASGRVVPEALREALRQGNLRDLPQDMAQAYPEARELLGRTGDPQAVDFLLDRACAAEMARIAGETGSAFLQGYVRLWVDAMNLKAMVRTHRLGKDASFLALALLPGGSVSQEAALRSYGRELRQAFHGALEQAAEAGERALRGETTLTEFERRCDNALLGYLRESRKVSFGEQPLVAYLAAREEELKAVRTILTGRLYHVKADTIRERLRDTYA